MINLKVKIRPANEIFSAWLHVVFKMEFYFILLIKQITFTSIKFLISIPI